MFYADRIQIQQVLLNLIFNASQSMERAGTRTNAISITQVIDEDNVIISVRDYGAGIDESIKEKLFKPFVTLKKEGMGVGLSICRSIIDDHDGKIWAENMTDGGAKFSFSLKIIKDEKTEIKVFIIDDDEEIRQSISLLLKSAGYRTESFSGTEQFLEKENYNGTGCILLDVFLGEKTGLELQAEIETKFECLPIIFITGQGNIPMSVEAMKKGALNFLQKPIDDKELFTAD